MDEARSMNIEHEQRIQRVMRVLQDGRICTPGTCPFCLDKAEAIVQGEANP